MADAAQEFLNKQLSKNRFTAEQQSRLDNSGGASVAGSGDGIVPAGEAYAKYGKMPSGTDGGVRSADFRDMDGNGTDDRDQSKPSTTSSAGGGDKYRGFGQDSDSGRNYSTGAWGSGDLDAAGLAAKYKLDTSKEGRGDGHIWGRNKDGSEVYIGKASMDLASNKDLIAAHSGQANSEEDDHSGLGEELSSAGDIKGAILTEWAGGADKVEAEPEKERTPIEHSPEVKQAKERVRAYEDNIMSGKTSSDIFGDTYGNTGLDLDSKTDAPSTVDNNQPDAMQRINNKYSIDLNKGASGIGTSSYEEPKSNEATASFLDSKKADYKSAYNFKPSTNSAYGA